VARLGTTAWALSLEGGGESEVVLDLESILDEPQVSPDGRWLAYISLDAGRWNVYVQPFRRPGERVRVSRNGGGSPKWRDDGQELFYVASDGQRFLVVEPAKGEELERIHVITNWTSLLEPGD